MGMPALKDITISELVDTLGGLREEAKEVKKREGFYKEALLARARAEGLDVLEGSQFKAMLSVETQSRLDTETIRADMSEEWIRDHSKGVEFQKLTFKKV